MGINLKPEVATELAQLAAAKGMSVEAYLEFVVRSNRSEPDITDSERKHEAVQGILALQKNVKPDPEGWTIRDYINHGHR